MMSRSGFLASVLALLVPSLSHAGDAQFMPLDTAVNYHASIVVPPSTAPCDLMMTMTHAADGLSAKVTAVTSSCGITAYGLPWDVLIETPAPSASGPASKLRVVGVRVGNAVATCSGAVVVDRMTVGAGDITIPSMTLAGTLMGMPYPCSVISFDMVPNVPTSILRL